MPGLRSWLSLRACLGGPTCGKLAARRTALSRPVGVRLGAAASRGRRDAVTCRGTRRAGWRRDGRRPGGDDLRVGTCPNGVEAGELLPTGEP
jgi:hypothetical protein